MDQCFLRVLQRLLDQCNIVNFKCASMKMDMATLKAVTTPFV
jgi:hypothetical protein